MSFKLIWCVEVKLLKAVKRKKYLESTLTTSTTQHIDNFNKLNFATHLLNITKNANIYLMR